jgi:transcriptional regulator with AAA-type ATPase domain
MSTPLTYPFVAEFLEAKWGTLYLLSDAQARIRDAHAVLTLVRFFARKGVDLDVRPLLAEHSPTFDTRELQLVFQQATDARKAETILCEHRSVHARILRLFQEADAIRRRQIAETPAGERSARLAARGPVLLLGRPRLFAHELLDAIDRELRDVGRPEGVVGRFEFPCNDPFAAQDDYRRLRDTYSGRRFPSLVFSDSDGPQADPLREYRDYAILRIVRGRYRSFVFAYGSGSLGTLAAAQTLIDVELNQMLVAVGAVEYLHQHDYVELLLRAEQRFTPRRPWKSELAPSSIRVEVRPVPPVPATASALLEWLQTDDRHFPGDGETPALYERRQDCRFAFDCRPIRSAAGSGPEDDASALGGRAMVGGAKVAKVVEELRKLARAPRPTALLLVGETGVGKEIAARVLFEGIALRRLRSLAEGKNEAPLPVVPGPRFIAVNCAALTETLSASELFGVGAAVGTGVAARRGPLLEAGEGVVLLDEIESMRTGDQASLLRVLDPPHRVTPVGTTTAVPVNAMVVACTNVEPTRLVAENRLRSDLFARLRVHTLEIPPLRERREDIPALLAFLAGGVVRIDPSALTALLLHDHPLNVRGLLAIVERARRRHELARDSGPAGETDPIGILREDLDAELIAIADDLFRESVAAAAEPAMLEFHAERSDLRLECVFQQAAEILSSYQVATSSEGLRLTRRPREARFDDLWERAERERSAGKAQRRDDPETEFVDRWLELVGDLERSLAQEPEALQQALDVTARLFATRWPKKGDQTFLKGLLGQKNKQRRAGRQSTPVQIRHLAASLGTNSSAIDNLIAKRAT